MDISIREMPGRKKMLHRNMLLRKIVRRNQVRRNQVRRNQVRRQRLLRKQSLLKMMHQSMLLRKSLSELHFLRSITFIMLLLPFLPIWQLHFPFMKSSGDWQMYTAASAAWNILQSAEFPYR